MNTDIVLWKVLHYAEYLLQKPKNFKKNSEKIEKNHGYGSWKGQIIISNDFDEPLEDLQEYM